MDSPIDPVNKGSEYVGLPKVDPWHESEKHKKKRFAKMLEDRMDDQRNSHEDEDAVELSGAGAGADETSDNAPETPTPSPEDSTSDNAVPKPPAHIDVKG